MIRPRELSRSLAMFPAKTPTLPPATHTNSYALGGREVVLIEPATPYENEQREWMAWARALESAGRTLVAVVGTHHHEDHVGGIGTLARQLGVKVWLHEETKRRLPPNREEMVTFNDGDEFVLDGPVRERWTFLHTPGHAPGHLCLWNESDRTLVVGDMVASTGTILIATGDGHMATYIRQLERLAGLGASLALPAHGDPIDAPTVLFEKYVKHRAMREAKVLAAVARTGREGGDVAELLPDAYDDTPLSAFPFAKKSLEAHLEKLVEEGRVERVEGRYRTTPIPSRASQ